VVEGKVGFHLQTRTRTQNGDISQESRHLVLIVLLTEMSHW